MKKSHVMTMEVADPMRHLGPCLIGFGALLVGCATGGAIEPSESCESNCGGSVGGSGAPDGTGGAYAPVGTGGLGSVAGAGGAPAGQGAGAGEPPGESGAGGADSEGAAGAPSTPPSTGGASPTGSEVTAPVGQYSLLVEAPTSGSSITGSVVVSGWAPGFQNVEVWDATHTNPPLAQAAPAPNGAFSATVNAASLAPGATTWTVHAWDSSPGQPFTQTANTALNLTIAGSDPCAGQSCGGGGGTADPGTAYVPAGYQLVFSDEFSGSTLDTGKWNTLAPYGVQYYSDSHQKQAFIPEAVSLANGIVTFTATPSTGNTNGQPYASGSITTNRTFTHGYFESRFKVPAGKGLWPAFWLTSSNRWPPEWDIVEIIDGVIFGYTHPVAGGTCYFTEGAAGSDSTYIIADLYETYHVYGFTWTASDLYWYVDGVMTEHYIVDAAAGANDPFWLNLMMQVGGDWPGDPDGTTPFPARMEVDYVRVYQL